MKKSIFISTVIVFSLVLTSCKTNKVVAETTENAEVWEGGITGISGIITEVTQEKDGQTIKLTNNKGISYTAVISIPNLGENHAQYRKFEVGENVGFRGETFKMGDEIRMVVKEVLETR
ncbi:hypothetical protein [Moheibacter sediminis]|uniref:DUF5666 domain-containing protein n=1 Tax=Moheibacter sediminis TaxID=1434700 RepID=A0A1W2AZC1_9FLAO|nr:hypothetical protein [Moheibacter sediminis]SMC65944.1 hypothetical protein SAMN06296427_105157 [Moheibacter sediminis]